jgi:hypothetical protein
VKRWQSGEMALRWTAAGMLEAERQFRKVIGYRDLAKLAVAIERDLARTTAPAPPRRPQSSPPPDRQTGTAVAKFHDERDRHFRNITMSMQRPERELVRELTQYSNARDVLNLESPQISRRGYRRAKAQVKLKEDAGGRSPLFPRARTRARTTTAVASRAAGNVVGC